MNDDHRNQPRGSAAAPDLTDVYRRLAAELRERHGPNGDDLLHDALIKFLRHRDTLRHPGAEVKYLRRVLHSTVADHFRATQSRAAALEQYRRTAAAPGAAEALRPPGPDPAVVRDQQREALAAWLRRSMATLPAPLGEVAIAVLVDGESQKGFAERRQHPYSTVKSQLQRARHLLAAAANTCCAIRFDAAGRVMDVRPKCCSS